VVFYFRRFRLKVKHHFLIIESPAMASQAMIPDMEVPEVVARDISAYLYSLLTTRPLWNQR
jgi:hypothetical protein